MLRLMFTGFVFSAFLGVSQSDTAAPVGDWDGDQFIAASEQVGAIDPIVTGLTISDEHKREWAERHKRFLECGLCGEEPQAFPGD